MKISVFSGLRSRPVCLIAGRLTEKESFPGQDERARAATAFETGSGGPEIKDPKRKKVVKDLHLHLAWMQMLCEVDRKFLASLDLRLMTVFLATGKS